MSIPRRFYPNSIEIIILERISKGERIGVICAESGMPTLMTWGRWCAEDSTLAEKYIRAQSAGLLARARLNPSDDCNQLQR